MGKRAGIFVFLFVMLIIVSLAAKAGEIPDIYVNDEKLEISSYMQDGIIYLPANPIAMKLGIVVTWNPEMKNVKINDIIVPTTPLIINGRLFLPVDSIANATGAVVVYDGAAKAIKIIKDPQASLPVPPPLASHLNNKELPPDNPVKSNDKKTEPAVGAANQKLESKGLQNTAADSNTSVPSDYWNEKPGSVASGKKTESSDPANIKNLQDKKNLSNSKKALNTEAERQKLKEKAEIIRKKELSQDTDTAAMPPERSNVPQKEQNKPPSDAGKKPPVKNNEPAANAPKNDGGIAEIDYNSDPKPEKEADIPAKSVNSSDNSYEQPKSYTPPKSNGNQNGNDMSHLEKVKAPDAGISYMPPGNGIIQDNRMQTAYGSDQTAQYNYQNPPFPGYGESGREELKYYRDPNTNSAGAPPVFSGQPSNSAYPNPSGTIPAITMRALDSPPKMPGGLSTPIVPVNKEQPSKYYHLQGYTPKTAMNDTFRITVTNVEFVDSMKGYYRPKPGYKYVIVYVSQVNVSEHTQVYTGRFSLLDSENHAYDYIEGLSNFWLVILKPGGVNSGYVVFELPANASVKNIALHGLNSQPLIVPVN